MFNELTEDRSKILIVDDTPENIDILGEILSEYKKFIATNGERALKLAKRKITRFDSFRYYDARYGWF